MQVVCAPGSFKGSLTAYQAAQAMAEGAKRVFAEAALRLVPMADGGEGTAQAAVDARLAGTEFIVACDVKSTATRQPREMRAMI